MRNNWTVNNSSFMLSFITIDSKVACSRIMAEDESKIKMLDSKQEREVCKVHEFIHNSLHKSNFSRRRQNAKY